MQTFVPHGFPPHVAAVLDRQRLGKQRVECLQIVNTLVGASRGWRHHPAVKMWRGHELALVRYGIAMCQRWMMKGFSDGCREKMLDAIGHNTPAGLAAVVTASFPDWIYDERVQLSHRSNLIRKLPEHYRAFWPNVPDDLPYVWPV